MRKVFLENLPVFEHRKGYVDWEKSIGYKVDFVFDDIKGSLLIVSISRGKCNDIKLQINYNDKLFYIGSNSLKKCRLSNIVGKRRTREFKYKYEIGDIVTSNENSFKIIDRMYTKKNNLVQKYYDCECMSCHYVNNKPEGYVYRACCDACSPWSKVVIEGVNDIPTTDPWMIDYFQGGYEEAKQYSVHSNEEIYPVCPTCKTVSKNKISISRLNSEHKISCKRCGDGISYPNKFVYSFLMQCGINFKAEEKFNWSDGKIYDFYFNNTIIEAHGLQHYAENTLTYRTLKEEQLNDELKYKLALENGIQNYIVLDCRESNASYIKNSILKSDLMKILDISENSIDWNKCNEDACSTRIKIICEYYNSDKSISTTDVVKKFKIGRPTAIKYLKIGTELGWCKYDQSEEHRKASFIEANKRSKRIICLENGYAFSSAYELKRRSQELFGKKLNTGQLKNHIAGDTRYSNIGGYHFKYLTYEEFDKMKIKSPELVFENNYVG